MKHVEILLTTEEVAQHYRMSEEAMRNARCRGEGLPWVKTPTGGVRYRLSDVLEWDNHVRGFTFDSFAKLIGRLTYLDPRQKRALLRDVDAAFRPQKVATSVQQEK